MPGPLFRRGDPVDLHPVDPDDVDFLLRNWNDPRVRRPMPAPDVHSKAALRSEMEKWADDDSTETFLGCVDGEPVGSISLFRIDETAGGATIGAWIDPDRHGEGYGRSMTATCVDYAFGERRLHRITAHAAVTNGPSRATLESVGFRQEGVMRGAFFANGEYVDRVVYGLLADEWDGLD